jgi:hypothetical protein
MSDLGQTETSTGRLRMSLLPSAADIVALQRSGPFSADIVAKVFLGWRTKILRAANASYARRREGPYRFAEKRPRTFVLALKSDAAAEKS